MQPPRAPVFLARETYRRRRLIDGLRLLPVVGLLMFLSPLVGGAGYLRETALSGVFIFAGWFVLIVATWVLGRLLARAPGAGDPLEGLTDPRDDLGATPVEAPGGTSGARDTPDPRGP